MGLTNPGRALGRFSLLSISWKLLTLSGIPLFSTNLFLLASILALFVWLNLSFLIGALVWFIKITKAVPFEFVEVFRKDPFLALHFSLYSSMISLLLCLLPSAALFTLTIWPFGPPPPRSPLRWRLHKELYFDCSAVLSTDIFLSIRANVRPRSSQWIPTKLTSSPISFYSASASVSIPLQLFLGSPSIALFSFLNMYLRWRPNSSHVSRPYAVSLLPHGAPLKSPSMFCINFFSAPSHQRFTRMVSLSKRYQYHQIGTPPPSGQSRHHRLPLVVPYPTSILRGFVTSPTSHPDSFRSFILWAGSSSPNLLSHFRCGHTWSETKTLQIVLESFYLHSFAHASFYFSYGGSSFLPFLSSLEPAFFHCGVHPFLLMLPLWSPSLTKVRLSPTLTLCPLMIWYSGQTALFLFLLARAALASLPTALSVALRPLFPFRQAQYAQVFLLKPTPFCTLFAGLGSTNKSAIFLLFSYYLTLVLFSPPCSLLHLSSYLKLCGRSGRNCLLSSPVLSGYNGSPDTHFSRGTTRLISWPDRKRYLRPLQSL